MAMGYVKESDEFKSQRVSKQTFSSVPAVFLRLRVTSQAGGNTVGKASRPTFERLPRLPSAMGCEHKPNRCFFPSVAFAQCFITRTGREVGHLFLHVVATLQLWKCLCDPWLAGFTIIRKRSQPCLCVVSEKPGLLHLHSRALLQHNTLFCSQLVRHEYGSILVRQTLPQGGAFRSHASSSRQLRFHGHRPWSVHSGVSSMNSCLTGQESKKD